MGRRALLTVTVWQCLRNTHLLTHLFGFHIVLDLVSWPNHKARFPLQLSSSPNCGRSNANSQPLKLIISTKTTRITKSRFNFQHEKILDAQSSSLPRFGWGSMFGIGRLHLPIRPIIPSLSRHAWCYPSTSAPVFHFFSSQSFYQSQAPEPWMCSHGRRADINT